MASAVVYINPNIMPVQKYYLTYSDAVITLPSFLHQPTVNQLLPPSF
jgi:hypothetical protein